MISLKDTDSNYVAQIIALPAPRKHSNADRLQVVTWQGNNIITGLSAKEGDVYVYFPAESRLNLDYLAFSNSFSDSTMNRDTTQKGMFEKHGRVRNIRLRGENSSGYIVPVADVEKWLTNVGMEVNLSKYVGKEFDTVGEILLCEKYVTPTKVKGIQATKAQSNRERRFSKIIPEQFRFHVKKTAHLGQNVDQIKPTDTILITYKVHGAAFSVSNILCNQKLNWKEKLAKFFKVRVPSSKYDIVYASRAVIKNQYGDDNIGVGYYGCDVWGEVSKEISHLLPQGITVYGEVAGFTPKGGAIQKGYDYGVTGNQHRAFIYRVTFTNPQGFVMEFTWQQVKKFCKTYGLETVPEMYFGRAADLFPQLIDTNHHWHEAFYNELCAKYLEKDCFLCANVVPEEGVVVTVQDGGDFVPWKLKSERFKQRESILADAGETNVEDLESQGIDTAIEEV